MKNCNHEERKKERIRKNNKRKIAKITNTGKSRNGSNKMEIAIEKAH